jgi:hypothetical protein
MVPENPPQGVDVGVVAHVETLMGRAAAAARQQAAKFITCAARADRGGYTSRRFITFAYAALVTYT